MINLINIFRTHIYIMEVRITWKKSMNPGEMCSEP
jgi:hypothetical protein